MNRSGSIALVRARGFGALPEHVERAVSERALTEMFEREGVPVALRDAPETPMPLRAMVGLFDRGASVLGSRTFGLEVGQGMTHRGYGLWVEYAASAPSLGEALRRAVATSWAQQSGGRLELAAEGDHRIMRFVTPSFDVSKTQYSDHLIAPFLTFLRLYLGPLWKPDWIEVDYLRDAGAGQVEDLLQMAMRCGRPGTGVALTERDLARERMPVAGSARLPTLREVLADVVLASAPEPARALSAVVALRLLDGRSDIEGAARLVGLSVQGLQRRLRQKGYSYREIVDLARRARAIRLLLETRNSVLSIGLSLGYETHASFTRAFVRWTGVTPTDFRRQTAPPRSGTPA